MIFRTPPRKLVVTVMACIIVSVGGFLFGFAIERSVSTSSTAPLYGATTPTTTIPGWSPNAWYVVDCLYPGVIVREDTQAGLNAWVASLPNGDGRCWTMYPLNQRVYPQVCHPSATVVCTVPYYPPLQAKS